MFWQKNEDKRLALYARLQDRKPKRSQDSTLAMDKETLEASTLVLLSVSYALHILLSKKKMNLTAGEQRVEEQYQKYKDTYAGVALYRKIAGELDMVINKNGTNTYVERTIKLVLENI